MNLIALQLKTSNNFEKNLKRLIKQINHSPNNSFILAPELYLTGYAYDRMDDAVAMSLKAIEVLKELSLKKTIALTLTTKTKKQYFNTLHIFHKGEIDSLIIKNK